jgi:hypothetical protein
VARQKSSGTALISSIFPAIIPGERSLRAAAQNKGLLLMAAQKSADWVTFIHRWYEQRCRSGIQAYGRAPAEGLMAPSERTAWQLKAA